MVWDVNLGLPLLISDTTYTYIYDLGPIGMVDAQGNAFHFLRDGLGTVTGITDANLHVTTYLYDDLSRLTTATNPVSGVTSYSYDANGNNTRLVDPAGNVITSTYDAGNRLAKVEYPERTVEYQYDKVGARTAVTETRSIWNWWNDGWSYRRPITISNGNSSELPVSHTVMLTLTGSVAADVYGKSKPSGDDLRIVYGWDGYWEELERDLEAFSSSAISVTFTTRTAIPGQSSDGSYYLYYGNANGGTPPSASLQWSGSAEPTLSTGSEQSKPGTNTATTATTYQYDNLNRLSTATYPGSLNVGYSYDRSGLRTKLTLPDAKAITSTYDAAGRLQNVIDWQSRTTTYAYDQGNRVTGITMPNGTSSSYAYDENNRTTAITNTSSVSGTLSSLGYTYDNVGNRTVVSELIPLQDSRPQPSSSTTTRCIG